MSEFSHEIVAQFIKGDESSFKVIFNFFYPRIYHFVRDYVPNDDLTENLVQDTFLILWENRQNLKSDTNINAWLYTVARNNCLKKHYLKLKQLSIGYILSDRIISKMGLTSLRIYATGSNLITFTKYPGFDPEISSSNLARGVDYGFAYPTPRIISIGFQIGL